MILNLKWGYFTDIIGYQRLRVCFYKTNKFDEDVLTLLGYYNMLLFDQNLKTVAAR